MRDRAGRTRRVALMRDSAERTSRVAGEMLVLLVLHSGGMGAGADSRRIENEQSISFAEINQMMVRPLKSGILLEQ